ncbi:c-type cytochrome biogenesis protein CcmI [Thalassococcus sp. S3]|uniref:c-type cytochrome biogenesis protein CcmI n=1 Tax=Thalassococcus sp. S3 TaxID=2017482 RepID=UPI0010243B60|nr:c-type cytochrome biogenesis protein CcmI [Thalassococcus sp. S3]QBF33276.1 c-type cytochrome biogenesis protein CcmI [Thalassococcus sp. S3]
MADLTTFWILTLGLAFLVAALLALALVRARSGAEPAAAYDLQVYRDQLKEIDRDLARGLINAGDAERIRAEVSRRILAADAQVQAETEGQGQPRLPGLVMAAVSAVVLVIGSALLYLEIGAPGYGDLALADRLEMAEIARSERPSQQAAEDSLPPQPSLEQLSPDFVALMERLRDTVAGRPDDLQGQILLAQNEARSGNFRAAYEAQSQVLRLKGDAVEARDYTDYADMMILAAGGYVSPEAETALARALELDPENGPARYYTGLMMGQIGRPDQAFGIWRQLLVEGPGDAPWIEPIRLQIEEMAARAGVTNFSLPQATPAAPGPSQEDVEAAEQMSDEDRMAMIEGMVAGLSDRLATEGGPPEDWARLIGSLGVLGREADAIAIYNNALEVFDGEPTAIGVIRDGARQAGLIP